MEEEQKPAMTQTPDGVKYLLDPGYSIEEDTALANDYLGVITRSIAAHPRSLQKEIGPSEIGDPCNRALLHKIAGTPEPPPTKPNWKATVGTAVHALLDRAFEADATTRGAPGYPARWQTERPVAVGEVPGLGQISGSTDLFDATTGTVIDHKVVGKFTLRKYKSGGPSEQYRIQANLYGKGWAAAGYPVKRVAIAFLPREGELSGDTYFWVAPYQPEIADNALRRLAYLTDQLRRDGLQKSLAAYTPCTDRFCDWCGTGSSWEKKGRPATTQELLGIGAEPAPVMTIADLIRAETAGPDPAEASPPAMMKIPEPAAQENQPPQGEIPQTTTDKDPADSPGDRAAREIIQRVLRAKPATDERGAGQ